MDPYIGEIRMFASNFAPQGWAFCNGEILSIAQNTALFSVLGTTYGGDGKTTFALPNLQGKTPIHWGQSNYGTSVDLGETGGTEEVTVTVENLPAHTHTTTTSLKSNVNGGTQTSPVNGYPANTGGRDPEYNNTANTVMGAKPNVTVLPAGQNLAMINMQPYLAVNFIIALEGIYPPRS